MHPGATPHDATPSTTWQRRIASLGPGLLWAGTAVGVSHLVQSTRAGAGYGLSLLWVVALALLTKYPGYEAAQRYTAATGWSLLEAYRRQGKWVLWVFIAQTVATMCIITAAVTIVTAGMAQALITDQLSVSGWSLVIMIGAAALLAVGQYRVLDLTMKVLMVVLSITSVSAVLVLLPSVDPSRLSLWPPLPPLEPVHVGFLAGLIGWMPAPLDTSVWHSMWSVERSREQHREVDPDGARFDFHVGYVGTALLAFCFVFLGAALIHGTGREIPGSAVAFATLLVDLYGEALGAWARPVILVAAFTTMVSTTLAVLDGGPRSLDWATRRLREPEHDAEAGNRPVYWAALAFVAAGGLSIIHFFAGNLIGLVQLATVVSFVLAPLLAVFNYRAVLAPEVPMASRPGAGLRWAHRISIAAMSLFTVAYLAFTFGR